MAANTPDILKPAPLDPGNQLALVSPLNSPPARFRDYTEVTEYVEGQGFVCLDETTDQDTNLQRSASFNRAVHLGYAALLPVAGNRYGSGILHRLDYEAFAQQRPLFVTFSAGSTLLAALHERTGVPVFYGPHIRFVADDHGAGDPAGNAVSFWRTLDGTRPADATLTNPFSRPAACEAGAVFIGDPASPTEMPEGKLTPLFLPSLEHAVDEKIITDVSGRILVLEADQISLADAHERLARLQNKVGLHHAAALCIAGLTAHPIRDKDTALEAELNDPQKIHQFVDNTRRLVGDDVPVVYGFPMGHGDHKLTVPYGVAARLDTNTGDIHMQENPLRIPPFEPLDIEAMDLLTNATVSNPYQPRAVTRPLDACSLQAYNSVP